MIKSRRMRWAGHVKQIGEDRIMVGKLEGKRSLGRPRGRWVGSIKVDLKQIGRGDIDWIDMV
jgi:hypothetical protein